MIEIWRNIEGYDGLYQVSNCGRVRRLHKTTPPRIMKPHNTGNGYLQAHLFHDGKHKYAQIHRLVAQAFVPNPENKPQINHINGIKTDNRAENLEWVTAAENTRHAFVTGLRTTLQGEDCSWAKFTNEQIRFIRDNPDGLNTVELARRFDTHSGVISQIQCGKKYRNADGAIRKPRCQKRAVHLPDEIRDEIRRLYVYGSREFGCYALARKYDVHQKTILRIIHEK